MPYFNSGEFYGGGYYRTLIANHMLEIEPTSQQHMAVSHQKWLKRQ